MNRIKRLLSFMLVLTATTGAWALEQDSEGYYLLGSLQDWQDFATLVQTTPTANARMTADIDLGNDQTMVGTISVPYQGSFDGQGHTLTVNYDISTDKTAVAPFACVGDATIQKLHVDGSIIQRLCGAGGVAGTIKGNLTVSQCWVSAYMYVQGYSRFWGTIGGIASYCDDPNVRNCKIVIEDCLFSGHLGSGNHCGGLMSHVHGTDGYNNSAEFNNCLNLGTCDGIAGSTGTFIRTGIQGDPYTITNCYFKTAWRVAQGTQATNEQLANGTTAAALQNNRAETIWVQDPLTNQPMLAWGNDATSLSEELRMKSEKFATAVYDLSGRRMFNSQFSIATSFSRSARDPFGVLNSQLPKGLYIVNGKKVIIK